MRRYHAVQRYAYLAFLRGKITAAEYVRMIAGRQS